MNEKAITRTRKSIGTHFSMCVQPSFIIRTGVFSANLVSVDMLELMDYFGTHHAANGNKDDVSYTVSKGEILDVPVLGASRWVYECIVEKSVDIGESTTYFCKIKKFKQTKIYFSKILMTLI